MPCFVDGGVVSLGMFGGDMTELGGGSMGGEEGGYLTASALLLCFDAPG